MKVRLSGQRRMAAGLGAVAVVVGIVACGSFQTEDDARPGDDAASDARALETSVPEGGSPDASAVPWPVCTPPACEDFESGSWTNPPWASPGGASVTIGDSTSGTHALDVVATTDGPMYIARPCPVGTKKIVVSANVRVVDSGKGGVDLLSVGSNATGDPPGIYLTRNAAVGGFQIEVNGNVAHVLTHTLKTFTHVVLEIDVEHQTYSYAVGNGGADVVEEGGPESMNQAFNPSNAYVLAGLPFTHEIDATWHVRVDDIDVETTP